MVSADDIKKFLFGFGSGDGSGSGDGDGFGSGDGSGDGDGSGGGFGGGDGYDFKLKSIDGCDVYYVDGVPSVFRKISGDIARGAMVRNDSFMFQPCYIAKHAGYFAHGATAKEAMRDAENKLYATLDIDKKIAEFKVLFKPGTEYKNQMYFDWHYILTGSCTEGRKLFMSERGLTLDGSMTPEQFIQTIKRHHGWNQIRELESVYCKQDT